MSALHWAVSGGEGEDPSPGHVHLFPFFPFIFLPFCFVHSASNTLLQVPKG